MCDEIQMTVTATPQNAQYLAALIELWNNGDRDFRELYAIKLLPALIRDIAMEFEGCADFLSEIDNYAEWIGWDERDKGTMLILLSTVCEITTEQAHEQSA